MKKDLYNELRPTSIEECYNTSKAFNAVKRYMKEETLPHVLLFVGPPGTGKTTLSRMIAKQLTEKYKAEQTLDPIYTEVHCGKESGKAHAIELAEMMESAGDESLFGQPLLIFCIDEAQELSKAAQAVFTKPVEDKQSNVYVILCCTSDKKLDKALLSRSIKYEFGPLDDEDARKLIKDVARKSGNKEPDDKTMELILSAGNYPREIIGRYQASLVEDLDDAGKEDEQPDSTRDFIGALNKYSSNLSKKNVVEKAANLMEEGTNAIEQKGPYAFRIIMCNYASKVLSSGSTQPMKRKTYGIILETFLPELSDLPGADMTLRLHRLSRSIFDILGKK